MKTFELGKADLQKVEKRESICSGYRLTESLVSFFLLESDHKMGSILMDDVFQYLAHILQANWSIACFLPRITANSILELVSSKPLKVAGSRLSFSSLQTPRSDKIAPFGIIIVNIDTCV